MADFAHLAFTTNIPFHLASFLLRPFAVNADRPALTVKTLLMIRHGLDAAEALFRSHTRYELELYQMVMTDSSDEDLAELTSSRVPNLDIVAVYENGPSLLQAHSVQMRWKSWRMSAREELGLDPLVKSWNESATLKRVHRYENRQLEK